MTHGKIIMRLKMCCQNTYLPFRLFIDCECHTRIGQHPVIEENVQKQLFIIYSLVWRMHMNMKHIEPEPRQSRGASPILKGSFHSWPWLNRSPYLWVGALGTNYMFRCLLKQIGALHIGPGDPIGSLSLPLLLHLTGIFIHSVDGGRTLKRCCFLSALSNTVALNQIMV